MGFWKKGTGRPSVTWPEVVDEALCFGWIDGIRKSIDAESYTNRLTPRRKDSIWSAINIAKVAELTAQGRLTPAGVRAFEGRDPARTYRYSSEQTQFAFQPEQEAQLCADPAAWAFWQSAAPSYRKAASWWVVSAMRAETRQRRLATLVADSAAGRTVKPLTPPGKRKA